MSTASLDAALSGLRAAQSSLSLISSNIANASTEGYTRKILPQETLVVAGTGIGVKLQAIVRNVDKALLRDLARQVSINESFSVKEQFLSRIQDFHGPSEAGRSLSARLGKLGDAFSALSATPDNATSLSTVLTAAQQMATTFNDYSRLLTNMRNETENSISDAVETVNTALEKIAFLNVRIANLTSQGASTADLEDQRDQAVRTVSEYLQVSTYYTGNNELIVLTRQGQALADVQAHPLYFNASGNTLPSSYYPGGGLTGLHLESSSGLDITQTGLGGKIGALFELRDQTLPSYQAQADELAQKIAERFDRAGLRLFTDSNGNVPVSVADPAPVGYVGFSAEIMVNTAVVADPTLLRSGTTGLTIPPGSNEIIRKVSEFVFGAYAMQEATGTVDISAGTLFATLGLTQINQVIGSVDLTDYAPDLDAAPNITAPADFTITIGVTPYNITIAPGDTATDLVNTINTAVGSTVASINGLGQLRLDTTANVTISDVSIGAAGIADLGLAFTTYNAQNPSFTVQAGTQSPVTITIAPGDTATDLLADLNAIAGINAALGVGGVLEITPENGGDLTLTNVTGTPLSAMGVTVSNIAHTSFRQNNLGPDGSLSTGLLANGSIEDLARNMITAQAQDHAGIKDRSERENTFYETLNQRNSNMTGVDIDQELSTLIRVQTAYTAAAKMITASEKMFNDLMAAFS